MGKKTNKGKNAWVIVAVLALVVAVGWNMTGFQHPDRAEGNQLKVTESIRDNATDNATGNSTYNASYEIPVILSDGVPSQILHRTAYITSYNRETRTPNWVGWVLTSDHTDGEYARGGSKFIEDDDVPEPRATYKDIRESECGYQRGHMCPAGDNKWSYKAQRESFLMTNICPQDGDLNQRDWKYLEEECRDWARKYGRIYIVAGPVFQSKDYKTVGDNKVAVPDAFFKVVLAFDSGSPKTIGFLYDNQSGHHEMDYYVRTVDEVESATGIDFFSQLEDSVERTIEAIVSLCEW